MSELPQKRKSQRTNSSEQGFKKLRATKSPVYRNRRVVPAATNSVKSPPRPRYTVEYTGPGRGSSGAPNQSFDAQPNPYDGFNDHAYVGPPRAKKRAVVKSPKQVMAEYAVKPRASPFEQDSTDDRTLLQRILSALSFGFQDPDAPDLPTSDDRTLMTKFISAMSYLSGCIFWFLFHHFTHMCIFTLCVLFMMPDHYPITLDETSLLVILLLFYFARTSWLMMPTWLQQSLQGELPDDDDLADANDDLASPTAILGKLNEMFALTYQHSDDLLPDDMPQYKIYVCMVSLLHLLTELFVAEPDWRDVAMRTEGRLPGLKELRTLQLYLDLADYAYEESAITLMGKLRKLKYQVIRHDCEVEPGRVGHYWCVSHSKKEVVVGIKGTSSFQDVLTDLIGKAVPHTLLDGKQVYCHEGMYTAASLMVDECLDFLVKFVIPAGYKIVICGHSLGAGVSCLLGIFLKQRGIPVQVYAFATPACLSLKASLECRSYVTSIVNNSDCVPRVSLVNIRTLNRLFLKIDQKLEQKGLSPSGWRSTAAYLKDISHVDSDLLMTSDEIQEFEEDTRNQESGNDDYSLYVPGRVVSMWNCHEESQLSVDCRVKHGGMRTLRHIEVSKNMICDHGTESYRTSLRTLIEQATS